MISSLRDLDVQALGRFFVGGVVSVGVTLAATALLHELAEVPEPVAAAIGLATALVVNFLVLRFFAFRGTGMPLGKQLLMFLGSSGVFRALEYGAFYVLHWLGVYYLLALVIVLGGSFIVKFLVYDRFVFARGRVHGKPKLPLP
jgi:putative flippase GtrA